MVGRAVAGYCRAVGDEVFAHDHRTLDITDAAVVEQVLWGERPDTIINCAAWTDVDGCEGDFARAFAVNMLAVERLAALSRKIGASLVTISTDYVFDGSKEGFYTQRDDPAPASVYGQAKLEGERRARDANARTTVVRTGWIFGAGGTNFLSKIFDVAAENATVPPLKAIGDSYGTPTYASDLAARLRELAELDLPGVYHVVNAGDGTSFYDFIKLALAAGGREEVSVEKVSMDDLQRPAPRPRNSRLRCLLSPVIGLAPLPLWTDSLRRFAAERIASTQ